MRRFLLTSAVIGALALSACGNKEASAPSSAGAASSAAKEIIVIPEIDYSALPDASLEPAAWMAENAKRNGVIVSTSGLQYTVNRQGDASAASPTPGQIVQVHYEGRLLDGTVFDSSYERGRPSEFPSDRLVPGWVEALAKMKTGDQWTLYVPPELGYGEAGREPIIPGNAVMVFKMELLGIDNSVEIAEAEMEKAIKAGEALEASEEWLASNAKREGVKVTASGLQYSIIESGPADGPTVDTENGQYVQVHYEGRLKDGSVFDSSYQRGEPAAFPSNQLVPGWVEALGVMRPGDHWVLYVSPELGYGKEGRAPAIPEDAVMIFRMELLQVAQPQPPAEAP